MRKDKAYKTELIQGFQTASFDKFDGLFRSHSFNIEAGHILPSYSFTSINMGDEVFKKVITYKHKSINCTVHEN